MGMTESTAGLSRRQFLRRSSLALPAAVVAPQLFMRGLVAAPGAVPRNLILVEMVGGNDGLNTIVPFGMNGGAYYTKYRPNLGVPEASLLKVPGEPLGFHPSFAEMKNHFDAGRLAVVQGVGYAQPNFSHKVSRQIWHTGSGGGPAASFSDGWLARYLNLYKSGSNPCAADVSDHNFPVFEGTTSFVPTIFDPHDYAFPSDPSHPGDALNRKLAFAAMSDALVAKPGKLGQIATTCAGVSDILSMVTNVPAVESVGAYSPSQLSIGLRTILTLLKADLGMRVFYVGYPDFDTHSQQNANGYHANALANVSQALNGFQTDLQYHGLADETLVVVFSEFGRTVQENGSGGTDHGTVNASFVLGNGVNGGFVNPHPSLDPTTLDAYGELPLAVDYRDVFSTVLARWLGESASNISTIFPGHTMTDLGFLS